MVYSSRYPNAQIHGVLGKETGMNKSIAAALCLSLVLIPHPAAADTPGAPVSVPAARTDTAEGTPLPPWTPPPPEETALVTPPEHALTRAILSGATLAGMAGGMILAAGGIGAIFSAGTDGFDPEDMHRGILMTISGSLSASLFSLLHEALTGGTRVAPPTSAARKGSPHADGRS
jgi:hypothetical protein